MIWREQSEIQDVDEKKAISQIAVVDFNFAFAKKAEEKERALGSSDFKEKRRK